MSVPNGQTTIYIGAMYEKNLTSGEVTTYYFAGSQRIAMRKNGGAPTWFVADHLGSTSVTLCGNTGGCGDVPYGGKVGEMKYYPFGETRPGYPSGNVGTDRRFTGQREENGLGSLYDYNARFYSPRWAGSSARIASCRGRRIRNSSIGMPMR